MNSIERRQGILRILSQSPSPVTATVLAERFSVTRQIIVSDIAILRAEGQSITASREGYRVGSAEYGRVIKTVTCRHDKEGVLTEFYAVVDQGGKVLDVCIEHPVYGQIRAELNIASRYDAERFVEEAAKSEAGQLCDLTGGVHMHTLSLSDEESFERITRRLREAGILIEE